MRLRQKLWTGQARNDGNDQKSHKTIMCAYHSSLKDRCQLMRCTAARAEESLETRRYPVAPSTGPSSGHSPDAFWTESSTSVPTAQLSFDFPGDVNELMSLDTNWALFPDSQWTGTDLHSLDSATDDSFSPIVSAHGSSSISPQEIEMIQDEVDKSVEDPAPPHVLDELCDHAPFLIKLIAELTFYQVHQILRKSSQ